MTVFHWAPPLTGFEGRHQGVARAHILIALQKGCDALPHRMLKNDERSAKMPMIRLLTHGIGRLARRASTPAQTQPCRARLTCSRAASSAGCSEPVLEGRMASSSWPPGPSSRSESSETAACHCSSLLSWPRRSSPAHSARPRCTEGRRDASSRQGSPWAPSTGMPRCVSGVQLALRAHMPHGTSQSTPLARLIRSRRVLAGA